MYRVTYHHKVKDDIKNLSNSVKKQIKKAIEEKLQTEPVFFGKPLQGSLKNLRSLRIGDYRVVFQLTDVEVYILLVAHRSVVYKLAKKR